MYAYFKDATNLLFAFTCSYFASQASHKDQDTLIEQSFIRKLVALLYKKFANKNNIK